MRNLLNIVFCFFIASGFAQEEAIYLETEEDGEKLRFIVHNTTNNPVEVELLLSDVDGLRGRKRAKASVPAKGKAEVRSLKIKGKYSFRYQLKKSYSEKTLASLEKEVEDVDVENGIVVFNKKGCPRCEYLTNYLMENDIDFQLVDLKKKENKSFMYGLLEESGVYEKRVMTPIVVVNGEISHSHQDLEKFASSLKKI